MKINLKPGKYVVAVSGGIDSVTLLHLLMQKSLSAVNSEQSSVAENMQQKPDHSSPFGLVVAHYDHGIRPNSADDEKFVRELAKKYELNYESAKGHLGLDASEALAREKRYAFLRTVALKYKANGIITAHHQDDLIETVFINLMRGTGRKGLTPMSQRDILRPLLDVSKSEIIDYAKQNNLEWVEDSTNSSQAYLRNRIRRLIADSDGSLNGKMLKIISDMRATNAEIDLLIEGFFDTIFDQYRVGDRQKFISLPYVISLEVLAYLLLREKIDYDARKLQKLCVSLKTCQNDSSYDVDSKFIFRVSARQISLKERSSV